MFSKINIVFNVSGENREKLLQVEALLKEIGVMFGCFDGLYGMREWSLNERMSGPVNVFFDLCGPMLEGCPEVNLDDVCDAYRIPEYNPSGQA